MVANTTADAHSGTRSLLTTNRTATFQRPGVQRHQRDVQRLALPGRAVGQAGAGRGGHAAARQPAAQPRHASRRVPYGGRQHHRHQRRLGDDGRRPSTARWRTRRCTLYVEIGERERSRSTSTTSRSRSSRRRSPSSTSRRCTRPWPPYFPVGAAVRAADLAGRFGGAADQALQQHDVRERHEVGRDGADARGPSRSPTPTRRSPSPRPTTCRSGATRWSGTRRRPAAVFNDVNGNPMTPTPENRALLIQRMRNHIQGGGDALRDRRRHLGRRQRGDRPVAGRRLPPQPVVQHHRAGVHRHRVPGRARVRADRQAPLQRLQHHRHDQAGVHRRAGQRHEEPGRADRRRRPPDAQQRRLPVGRGGDQRPQHDPRAGRRERGHRAGRQRLQQLVPGSGHRLHRTSRPTGSSCRATATGLSSRRSSRPRRRASSSR